MILNEHCMSLDHCQQHEERVSGDTGDSVTPLNSRLLTLLITKSRGIRQNSVSEDPQSGHFYIMLVSKTTVCVGRLGSQYRRLVKERKYLTTVPSS